MKILKRYANRKIYDNKQSAYVNYRQLIDMLTRGMQISVIDNVTKEDVTSKTLIAALSAANADLTTEMVDGKLKLNVSIREDNHEII